MADRGRASTNKTRFGRLYGASSPSPCARIDASSAGAPARNTTNAVMPLTPGRRAVSVTAIFLDKPLTESIGPAPYDDGASQNGILFPPSGAAHQTQIGDASYQQGGGDPAVAATECEKLRQRGDDFFGPTATITYEATGKCASAIAKITAATKAVEKAKKKVKGTTGPAHAAAVVALNKAKAKLKAAKKSAKKACK